MTGFANYTSTFKDGGLGRIAPSEDGVAGMVGTGAAVAGQFALGDVMTFFGMAEVEAKGINAAYDTTNSTKLWKECSNFYQEAGEGAELWLKVVSPVTTLDQMVAVAGAHARDLLDRANGRIRLLGVFRVPSPNTNPSPLNGFAPDVTPAVPAAQALADQQRAKHCQVSIVIEGRHYTGLESALLNYKAAGAASYPDVSITMFGAENMPNASVGLVLGRAAASPVQRRLGRVRSGPLKASTLFLSNAANVETALSQLEAIHNKGYIVPRRYASRSGYFLAGDHTLTPITSDFSMIPRRRIMGKIDRILDFEFTERTQDEVPIDQATGRAAAIYIKGLESDLESAITARMLLGSAPELSAIQVIIDPNQNILSSDKIKITVRPTPVGYSDFFEAEMQYNNPFNATT